MTTNDWIVRLVRPIPCLRRPATQGGRLSAQTNAGVLSGGNPMKMRFAALAVALVVSSVGCTAVNSCGPGGTPCHVATSQMAPRASMLQGRCGPGHGLIDQAGWTQQGCNECVACGDGCGGGCGLFGSGEACGTGACCGGDGCGGANGCLQNGLSALLDCNGGCGGDRCYNFQPGPPVGQIAYPYYTTRGPRDFLMCNPPSIGPR